MLVRDWMSTNVISVDATDTMLHAMDLLTENHVSMMPVMEEGKLVGIVTDRDLKRASPSDASPLDFQKLLYHLARLEVGAIMNRHPITVPVNCTIAEAALILLENQISGCPVVDDAGEIKGVITKNDMFKVMISMTGLKKKGIEFALRVSDQPGTVKELTDVIRKHDARVVSVLSSYEKAPKGYRHIYLRVFNVNREIKEQLKQDLNKIAQLLYIVDHREGQREIFTMK